ncbi:MAG: hypothetical protein LBR66_05960 [Candidatus Symbiothrix sp.]|jgi:tetratricopeptide (TPR) repeat protein|nr:hypothetical protein [Candidatus Symbiothrix sp.]
MQKENYLNLVKQAFREQRFQEMFELAGKGVESCSKEDLRELMLFYQYRGIAWYYLHPDGGNIFQVLNPIEMREFIAEQHFCNGAYCLFEERYADAIPCFDRALKAKEESMAYLKERGLEFTPDMKRVASYYRARGEANAKLGNYENALNDLDYSIELNPDAAHTYIVRGWVKDQLHDTDGSATDYVKAYELDPELTNKVLTMNKL